MLVQRLFGLRLVSAPPIPGVTPVESDRADVTVSFKPALSGLPHRQERPAYVSRRHDEAGNPLVLAWTLNGGETTRLRFAEGAEFSVERNGGHVAAEWHAPLRFGDAVSYLLGPVLGFVLRLRGTISLHASAVVIDGHAVAFAGPSGIGKSTLAAALGLLGHDVLADDLVALVDAGDAVMGQPGPPWLRLGPGGPDALAPLAPLPQLAPTSDDGYLDLPLTGGKIHRAIRPAPLAAIYVLEEACADLSVTVHPVSTAQAVGSVAAASWAGPFGNAGLRRREFDVLTRMLANVPVRRIRTCRGSDATASVRAAVLNDFAECSNRLITA